MTEHASMLLQLVGVYLESWGVVTAAGVVAVEGAFRARG